MEFEIDMCEIKIEYERETGHCSVSPYVKEITIKSIEKGINSDNLYVVSFEEMGWNAVTSLTTYEVGQKVMFIPPESVLPNELGDKLNITKYLSKGRVKVSSFRGNRSEGIIVNREIVEPYLPHIMKWEDLPTIGMAGEQISPSDVPYDFIRFYKMPNILNEPNTFKGGDDIWFSEKIHGSNSRCGWMIHPTTGNYEFYVGSHEVVFKLDDSTNPIYKQVVEKYKDVFPKGVEFFFEVYGRGIQDLHYDCTLPSFRIFAACTRGYYISIPKLIDICDDAGLPRVNFWNSTFESLEEIRTIADTPSEYTTKHMREGIVIVSGEHPEKMAKCLGFKYLDRKGKKTERH